MELKLFRKEHRVKRYRIDCPAVWGGVNYFHSKAMDASFYVAWSRLLLEQRCVIQREKGGLNQQPQKWPGCCEAMSLLVS